MSTLGDELRTIMAAMGPRLRLVEPEPEQPKGPIDIHGVPSTYEWARTADGLAKLVGWPAVEKLRQIARQRPRMACLWGSRSGTGKTASAVLLARGLAPDGCGYFLRATELAASMAETGYGSVPDTVHRARGTRVLVLDDLGIEAAHESVRAAMCDLVWRRADSERPGRVTVVTTSLSPDELTRRYGDGMTRRLHQLASLELAGERNRNP